MIPEMVAFFLPCLLALVGFNARDCCKILGVVEDITGSVVPGAVIELHGANVSGVIRVKSDGQGVYEFSGIPPGHYTLVLLSPGFLTLTVDSIQVNDENVSIPPVRLDLGMRCGDPNYQVLRYLRLTNIPTRGSLVATAESQRDYFDQKPRALGDARVTLFCAPNIPCDTTTTDSQGKFMFTNLRPGTYSVSVSSPGTFTAKESGFIVQAGFSATYWPLIVNRCGDPRCDPKRKPKKPIALCQ